jgi:putative peptidoglycan lipid II flippase
MSLTSAIWSRVSAQTPNAKIFRAGAVVSILGASVSAITAVKDVVIARYFGRNDAIDAFFIAYLLPSFVVSLAIGSLGAALIPVLVDVRRQKGLESAQELVSAVGVLSLLALVALAVVLGLLCPLYLPYLGSAFSSEKLRLTRDLLWALLPFVVFSGMSQYITSVSNAGERFALPAATPLITPVVVILFIALASAAWGACAIVAGTVAGSIMEAAILAKSLQRQGLRFLLRWSGFTEDVRAVLRQYSPVVAGSFLIGSTTVVDKAMAAMLPAGSVAALSYANKVISGVMTIGAAALSTATFPYFSQMVSAGDWAGCRHTLKRYSALVLAVTVPFTLLLIVFSRPIVAILFQRGAFTAADTNVVSRVQICYLIQVPFYAVAMLFVKFLSAAKRNRVLMYGAAMSLVLDVGFNLILMKWLGVSGIALSTALVYAASFVYVVMCTAHLLGTRAEFVGSPKSPCLEGRFEERR